MPNYALMGDTISNAAGTGAPNFPFGITVPTVTVNPIKDIANGATYTITNTDGFSYFTSSVALTANKGFVLPVAANNIGRRLSFKRNDTAGNAAAAGVGGFLFTITTQASDVIDQAGCTTTSLTRSQSHIELIAESPGFWRVLNAFDWIENYIGIVDNLPGGVTSGQWFDFWSRGINIPSGFWELSTIFYPTANTAVMNNFGTSILTTPGNTGGAQNAQNFAIGASFNTGIDNSVSLPSYAISLTTATLFYGKGLISWTSGGPPKYTGRFTAVRRG